MFGIRFAHNTLTGNRLISLHFKLVNVSYIIKHMPTEKQRRQKTLLIAPFWHGPTLQDRRLSWSNFFTRKCIIIISWWHWLMFLLQKCVKTWCISFFHILYIICTFYKVSYSQIACKYDENPDKNAWIASGKFICIIVTPKKKLSHRNRFN